MPRYIDADALEKAFCEGCSCYGEDYCDGDKCCMIKVFREQPTADVQEVKHGLTDLYIRDKCSGKIHKIGDDPHDMLYVDDKGTIHYQNLRNGDGCTGYESVNRKTLGEEYPQTDWGNRATEYCDGYEFVPNLSDDGYPLDPTKEDKNNV